MNHNGSGQLTKPDRDQVIELAAAVCNDELTESQTRQLDKLLLDCPAAQEVYGQYVMMHAELFWLEDANVGPAHSTTNEYVEIGSLRNQSNAHIRGTLKLVLSLAAVLLVGLGLGIYGAKWFEPADSSLAENTVVPGTVNRAPALDQVAKVTGTLNCRWKTKQSEGLGFGSKLYAGQQLELIEGVAEITFQTGARMILQAPAELDISSIDETVLHSGRLTTTCPPGAEGFRINTQELALIDLGTEFGVLADEFGNTEVHVFEGLVEGHYRESDDGPIKKVQWQKDETVRYDRNENKISPLEQSDTSFVRTLSQTLGPISGLLAGEDFDYPVGRLGGQNGGFGWAGPWQDMSFHRNSPDNNAVAAGSLRYGILTSSGNHASLQGQFNRIRRNLSTSYSGVFDTAGFVEEQDGARMIGRDGTTLFISFAQEIDKLNHVFYGVELNRGDGNRNRVLCIGHAAARSWKEDAKDRAPDKSSGVTGWAVTSEFNGKDDSLLELGDLGPETTDVTLFVLKISFGKSNQDTIEVFMNPESLWDETRCTPDVLGKGNFSFDRISLANFEGRKTFNVDHIRIGKSFSAVTRPRWQNESPVSNRPTISD